MSSAGTRLCDMWFVFLWLFFCKQQSAYEIRISDWSSGVCSSDLFVDHAAQQKSHEALDPNPKVTLHDYPALDHGFAATSGNRRDEEGAKLADGRTRAFFAGTLA